MPRRRRSRQADFVPGTTGTVEGPFEDEDGKAVTVAVTVRSCEAPGDSAVTVDKADGRWSVELPPDSKHELTGLVGDDGVKVRLTIVAGPCTEPDPVSGDETEQLALSGTHIGVEADVAAEEVFDLDDVDIAAPDSPSEASAET